MVASNFLVGKSQPPHDFFGHLRADRLMPAEADASRWSRSIVGGLPRSWKSVAKTRGTETSFGRSDSISRVWTNTSPSGWKSGGCSQPFKDAISGQDLAAINPLASSRSNPRTPSRRGKNLDQFVSDPFGADVVNGGRAGAERHSRCGFDGEVQHGGESHRAQRGAIYLQRSARQDFRWPAECGFRDPRGLPRSRAPFPSMGS